MIKFVDLETGNLFSGEKPHIFWFPKGQGINMIYSQPICFINDMEKVRIDISKNPIFKLATIPDNNILQKDYINDVEYIDINSICSTYINSVGKKYKDYYIHIFYIIAQSEIDGEFLEEFSINGQPFKIGADFYSENESLYINLANNGQDIPKEIQKALYPANVHEDKIDNILLNRKWKELLSNFWDVMANKGSYKSLINSLNWFEYGDLLQIYEVWKHIEDNREIFDLRSLQEVLGDKYFESLNGFAKTTYIAIHLALSKIVEGELDDSKNPVIEKITDQWSYNDLMLKLSMLGKFYETYFMPIHLNLIHCTIEDVVYTNTIKIISSGTESRFDYQYNTEDIDCNIKDNQTFVLSPIHAEAGDKTIFNLPLSWDLSTKQYSDIRMLGVDKTGYLNTNSDNSLKSFLSQYYNEIGVIIPFEIRIKLEPHDFIKSSTIICDNTTLTDHHIFRNFSNYPTISFNILCTKEQEYDIKLQFDSAGGKVYTKKVKINIIDIAGAALKVYKIQNIGMPTYNTLNNMNDYILGRQNTGIVDKSLYMQYIPAKKENPLDTGWKGVALNNILVLDITTLEKYTEGIKNYINANYFTKELKKGEKTYLTCVSKIFGFEPNLTLLNSILYTNRYSFIPEFHKLIPLDTGENILENFTITDDDTLCVIPELKFGKQIIETEWEFVNVSKLTPKSIKINRSVNQPFVAPTEKKFLDPGYYNIVFRYKLSDNKVHEIVLNSAFRKI